MTEQLLYGATTSLELANIIRRKRSEFKARLDRIEDTAMQHEMVATLVWMPPRWAAAWRVRDVLDMVRWWGDKEVEAAMRSVLIHDANRTLHSLTTRQAGILAEFIRTTKVVERATRH